MINQVQPPAIRLREAPGPDKITGRSKGQIQILLCNDCQSFLAMRPLRISQALVCDLPRFSFWYSSECTSTDGHITSDMQTPISDIRKQLEKLAPSDDKYRPLLREFLSHNGLKPYIQGLYGPDLVGFVELLDNVGKANVSIHQYSPVTIRRSTTSQSPTTSFARPYADSRVRAATVRFCHDLTSLRAGGFQIRGTRLHLEVSPTCAKRSSMGRRSASNL